MPLATQNPMSSIPKVSTWFTCPQTQCFSHLASRSGGQVIRTFKAHHTQSSIERIVSAMEENPNRQNIKKVWKDYATEDVIAATEKAMPSHQARNNSCWRKLCPDAVHDFKGFMTKPIKEIKKEIEDTAKKKEWGCVSEGFQDMHLREIQEPADTTQEKLTEDNLLQMSASEPVPDNKKEDVEAAVPEIKLTFRQSGRRIQLFKTAFEFFYDMT